HRIWQLLLPRRHRCWLRRFVWPGRFGFAPSAAASAAPASLIFRCWTWVDWFWNVEGLSADFDDLTFKDLKRFLNQGIVLEIVFFERNRGEFFFGRWRRGGASGRHGGHGFGRLRGGGGCRRNGRFLQGDCRTVGVFGLDELKLRVWVAEF